MKDQSKTKKQLIAELESLRRQVAELRSADGREVGPPAPPDRTARERVEQALQREHAFVRLLQSVAVAANEAVSVGAAFRVCLDQVCAHTGWPVGHAFVVDHSDPNLLLPSGPWHLAHEAFEEFRTATEAHAFQKGKGLPGRVLDIKQPLWMVDLTEDRTFLRVEVAKRVGLRAGFAFPVLVRDQVVAVLEFFYPDAVPPDEGLLEVARHVGTQLGRVIERKRAEDALRVTRMQQQALSRRLLEIQELERSRIARELHDQIGQALTAVKLNLEATRHGRPIGSQELAEGIATIDQAIEQVRTLSFELRPAVLDDLGLAVAMGSYARRQTAKAGLALDLRVEPINPPVQKEVETACFRIFQEALTNVLRHAEARRLAVILREADDVLHLNVSDDGKGFDANLLDARGAPTHRQLGLLGMRERAQNVGGLLQVESRTGEGTTILVQLPLRERGRLERRLTVRPR